MSGEFAFEIGRTHKHTTARKAAAAPIAAEDGVKVCMPKVHKLQVLVTFINVADVDMVLTVRAFDDVAGTNPVTLDLAEFDILYTLDIDATDSTTRATAAASYTIDAGSGADQKVLITIRPEDLWAYTGNEDKSDQDKTAVAINFGANDAGNTVYAEYFAIMRYDDDVSLLTDL